MKVFNKKCNLNKPKSSSKANAEKLERIRENRRKIANAFLVLYKRKVFMQRLEYKSCFRPELVNYWTSYLNESQIALNHMEEKEKQFLEKCFEAKMDYRKIFFSRSAFYRCLIQYANKFLSLFDYELFHNYLAHIYNSILDDRDNST